MKRSILAALSIYLAIACALLSIVCSEKFVIDTDGGADDAAAILLALSAWEKNETDFEVVAITCVNGNTVIKNVEKNVLKTITIGNASRIPVYGRGAQKPLVGNLSTDNYFGNDGLGDFTFTEKITAKVDQSTYASIALINLAAKYPQQLSVLCLGPLTNIALAVSLDPNFMLNVKRFYIVGGSVTGIGNVGPGLEFNFAADPESNFIVLNYTRNIPSLLFPWEAALNAGISKNWRVNKLGSINSSIINFLNKAESKSLKDSSNIWSPLDLIASAIVIWPHLLKKSLITNVSPVIDGAGRGTILIDYENMSGKPKNVEIVQKFLVEEFKEKLLRYFS